LKPTAEKSGSKNALRRGPRDRLDSGGAEERRGGPPALVRPRPLAGGDARPPELPLRGPGSVAWCD